MTESAEQGGQLDRQQAAIFRRKLRGWFRRHARAFAWRKTRDPYRVLVAEMLLQQTDAAKVVPVYKEFLRQYPRIDDLASARLDRLQKLIRPLGLAYRAVRLKRLARQVVADHGGRFPRSGADLNKLYGIGDYMTNAVLSFAFEEPVPIVDTNVIRVFSRFFGIRSQRARAHTDRRLWEQVRLALPAKSVREFNLALLDFAALVCTAQEPKCVSCVMRSSCKFYKANRCNLESSTVA